MSSGEADGAYSSKQFNCNHINTGFHYDNPNRFTCLDCKKKFIDLGHGWVEDRPKTGTNQHIK